MKTIAEIQERILKEFEEQQKKVNPCSFCEGTGVESTFSGTCSISRVCPNCNGTGEYQEGGERT